MKKLVYQMQLIEGQTSTPGTSGTRLTLQFGFS